MLKPILSRFLTIFTLLHLQVSLSTTPPSEIAALKSLKSAINPSTIPPSSCLASWDFTLDPCSKPITTHFICGLTCSPTSRVVSITLDSVGYVGTLTPLISQLTQLIILDLGQNSFHGIIPPSISSLSLLQTLTLRSNSLSGTLPSSIAKLQSLKDADLSNNLISGSLPNTLSSLSQLTRLDLSFNKLTGGLPKLPPKLQEFAVKANSLSGSILKPSFAGLTQLETVELSSNSFTGKLQPWFFQILGLQQINLSNNSLTGVEIWKPTDYSSSLVAVDLGFNKIEGYVPVNFSEFAALASLSLRYNRLRGPIPLEYSKKGLKRLFLDGNYLSGTLPPGLIPSLSAGSFGDNCLRGCPPKSPLCLPSQKPMSVCKQVYGGKKPRSN